MPANLQEVYMIYILEGPDGGGKTTLAEKLSAMTRIKITHFSYPRDEEEKARLLQGRVPHS